ncbi:MAG: flagellar biosynthesis protein FlhF [Pirellulales bacterium]
MNVKTYRAKTMQEALAQVRRDLGPKASVLHTREVRAAGLMRFFNTASEFEVMASANVTVPSRLAARDRSVDSLVAKGPAIERRVVASGGVATRRSVPAHDAGPDLHEQLARLHAQVARLRSDTRETERPPLDDTLFRLFTDLIEADVNEDLARELVERVREHGLNSGGDNLDALKSRVVELVQNEIRTMGPVQPTAGRRHLVALVGPTGVGKTTTIAKLAANFRLREKLRVGLITVDTYRIAAVEQLRTYADIIDLPMEIVATPREMHQAVARMADQDLILMDTAGRSPRDEVKIQELKAMLAEAAPDEVHLVLSSVSSATNLTKMAEQFSAVGTTAIVMTKLDEAASLGNLLPLVRASGLPLSYLTHGQNVPDDIAPADANRLARVVLGMEPLARP